MSDGEDDLGGIPIHNCLRFLGPPDPISSISSIGHITCLRILELVERTHFPGPPKKPMVSETPRARWLNVFFTSCRVGLGLRCPSLHMAPKQCFTPPILGYIMVVPEGLPKQTFLGRSILDVELLNIHPVSRFPLHFWPGEQLQFLGFFRSWVRSKDAPERWGCPGNGG